jgi:hypothetical protein
MWNLDLKKKRKASKMGTVWGTGENKQERKRVEGDSKGGSNMNKVLYTPV